MTLANLPPVLTVADLQVLMRLPSLPATKWFVRSLPSSVRLKGTGRRLRFSRDRLLAHLGIVDEVQR